MVFAETAKVLQSQLIFNGDNKHTIRLEGSGGKFKAFLDWTC